jgi:hypothetical protein
LWKISFCNQKGTAALLQQGVPLAFTKAAAQRMLSLFNLGADIVPQFSDYVMLL